MLAKEFPNFKILLYLILNLLFQSGNGHKILFYSVISTLSHHMVLHPLAIRLAQNAHQVTYLSSYHMPTEDSRINYFYPTVVVNKMSDALSKVAKQEQRGQVPNDHDTFYPTAIEICQAFYASEEVQQWISHSSFDLVIIDPCFNECALGLAHKFKSFHIMYQTATLYAWHSDVYGIPSESSWIPDLRLNYTYDMNFLERTLNTLSTLHMYLVPMSYNYYPAITEVIRNGLNDPSVPTIPELQRNISLMFVNSYFAVENGRALPPFVIPIGGAHIGTLNQTLPLEIEKFISKFEHGFMFVSFGTAFKLSRKSQNDFVYVMTKKFPEIGFIVTWIGDPGKIESSNLLFLNWAPQQLLLAHPKIRAFLSHCGMLSSNEVAYYGVPVLAAPGFVDQDYNAETLVKLGGAVRIELTDFTADNLEYSMRQVLYNDSYRNKMKMISEMYRDRPQHPLETAVWWTEYVLKHGKKGNDLSLLKPLGIYQPWYQRRLLDVHFFIFSLFTIGIAIILKIGITCVKVYNSPRNLIDGNTKKQKAW